VTAPHTGIICIQSSYARITRFATADVVTRRCGPGQDAGEGQSAAGACSSGQTLAATRGVRLSRSQLQASQQSVAPPPLQGNAELEGPAFEEGPDGALATLVASCSLGAVVGFFSISRRRALSGAISSALGVCALAAKPQGAFAQPGARGYDPDAVVDLNNSKPGDYSKLPGMFPTISALIMKYQGQWKEVKDLYKLKELDEDQMDIIRRYEKNLTVTTYVPVDPKTSFIGSRGQ